MSKRQDIISQIFFIVILVFIIFLLWGYGAGWLGASADVNAPKQNQGFVQGVINGVEKVYHSSLLEGERNIRVAL